MELRSRSTGDELPHFARAYPALDAVAVALGRRLELWRLHDLKPLMAGQQSVVDAPDPAEVGASDPVMVAAFSPCGRYLAAAPHDGRVRLLRLEARMEETGGDGGEGRLRQLEVVARCETPLETAAGKPYRDLAFHPGGRTLVGACEDGSWRAWEIVEGLAGGGGQQPPQTPMASSLSPPPASSLVTPRTPIPQQQQLHLQLRPLFALPATTHLLRTHTAENPNSVAAAAAKDQHEGLLFTCRCGRFTPDGAAFFTLHYPRRAPKKGRVDKRPVLTRWAVDLSPSPPATAATDRHGQQQLLPLPIIERLRPTHATPVGTDPLMCLALAPDGLSGAAGDCSGRTLHFRTRDARVLETRAGMHNFGVTSLAFSSPPPLSSATAKGGDLVQAPRLVSSSGDKTLRLQYLQTPPHLLWSAARAKTRRPKGVVGAVCSLLGYALLALLLLSLWLVLCAALHGMPLGDAISRVALVVEKGVVWKAASPYVERLKDVYAEHSQAHVEACVAVVRPVWGWVGERMGPWWAAASVKVLERVEGFVGRAGGAGRGEL